MIEICNCHKNCETWYSFKRMDAVELERRVGRVEEEEYQIALFSVNLHLMKNAPQWGQGGFMSQYGIDVENYSFE